MKRFFLLLISSTTLLFSVEEPFVQASEDEIARIDHLIEATQVKLQQQKELKELVRLFQQQEERFFKGDQSKGHAAKMVSTARQILERIKEAHLEHLFSSEYLEELALFSSIAGKSTPKRP